MAKPIKPPTGTFRDVSAKQDAAKAASGKVLAGGNGYDEAKVLPYLERLHNLDEECASIMGKAMNDCKALREDQKEIFDEAKDNDRIPKKVLRLHHQKNKHLRKAAACDGALEDDDQDIYEAIDAALGDFRDTLLGRAALETVNPAVAPATAATAH